MSELGSEFVPEFVPEFGSELGSEFESEFVPEFVPEFESAPWVNRHRAAIYRAALAALGSHADAEDAARDAFLLAFRRLGSFRGDASFKTWLLTIAWHQAINRRRSLVRMWRRMIEPTFDPAEAGHESMMPASRPRGRRLKGRRGSISCATQSATPSAR